MRHRAFEQDLFWHALLLALAAPGCPSPAPPERASCYVCLTKESPVSGPAVCSGLLRFLLAPGAPLANLPAESAEAAFWALEAGAFLFTVSSIKAAFGEGHERHATKLCTHRKSKKVMRFTIGLEQPPMNSGEKTLGQELVCVGSPQNPMYNGGKHGTGRAHLN